MESDTTTSRDLVRLRPSWSEGPSASGVRANNDDKVWSYVVAFQAGASGKGERHPSKAAFSVGSATTSVHGLTPRLRVEAPAEAAVGAKAPQDWLWFGSAPEPGMSAMSRFLVHVSASLAVTFGTSPSLGDVGAEILRECVAGRRFSQIRATAGPDDLAAQLVWLASEGLLTSDGNTITTTRFGDQLARLAEVRAAPKALLAPIHDDSSARWEHLVTASTESELESAFATVFDVANDARCGGPLDDCESLLRWLVRPEVLSAVHIEVLLPCVRLTFSLRDRLPSWSAARDAMAMELGRRGQDVEVLMCGLRT